MALSFLHKLFGSMGTSSLMRLKRWAYWMLLVGCFIWCSTADIELDRKQVMDAVKGGLRLARVWAHYF